MTPEGKVKSAVTTYLTSIGCISASKAPLATQAHHGWFFAPVSNGMGVHGIPDIIGAYRGFFFAIETKVEKKDPTALQWHQINAISVSGGASFVVRGVNGLAELKEWVELANFKADQMGGWE